MTKWAADPGRTPETLTPIPLAPYPGVYATRFIRRLKLFLALSRTPHGLLDMAMPVVAAMLWLGHLPTPRVMWLGLFTVFAGYTAVYAVNDLADHRTDRANLLAGPEDARGYMDAICARHPVAMGLISFRAGLAWAAGWAVAAMTGAWLLNPVCAWIMLAGCVLEVIYCGLLKVTHLRTLAHGVIKTLGSVAAVLAVDSGARWPLVACAAAPIFLWEIGGQNIPADWFDLEMDRRQGAKTLCVTLGLRHAAMVSLIALSAATLCAIAALRISPAGLPPALIALTSAVIIWIMPWPAWKLMRGPSRRAALRLFTRASFFPMTLFCAAAVWFLIR